MDERYYVNQPNVIAEVFDDEVVIINLDSGNYYSLGGAGRLLWTQLEAGASAATLETALLAAYEVDAATARTASADLVAQLAAEGIATTQPTPATATTPATSKPRQPWTPPIFASYTDMQALLLLDPVHDVDVHGWPQVAPTPVA